MSRQSRQDPRRGSHSGESAEERQGKVESPQEFFVDEVVGAKEWKRSKVGYLLGFGAVRQAVSSTRNVGAESVGRLRTIGAAAFAKDGSGVAVDESVTDPHARFMIAMEANGKTPDDIARSIAVTYKQFWFFATLMVLAFVLGIGSLAFGLLPAMFWLPIDLAFRLAPLPILAALALRAGYTNWMFRKMRLESVVAYFGSGQILPEQSKSGSGGGRKAVVVKRTGGAAAQRGRGGSSRTMSLGTCLVLAGCFALAAGTALFPSLAMAQEATNPAARLFDTDQNDMFMSLLSYIIPDVGPVKSGLHGETPQHVATKTAFMAFSGTLMFIAGIVSGWQIISGIVAAAKEGTVLGKQYHEVWAPMRVVLGYGMLAPVAGGLCAAQIIVLYMIVWGGNLANMVWTPYIEVMTFAPQQTSEAEAAGEDRFLSAITSSNMGIGNATIRSLMQKELCHATLAIYYERGQQPEGPDFIRNPQWSEEREIRNSGWNLVRYGSGVFETVQTYDYGTLCGTIDVRIQKAGQITGSGYAERLAAEAMARKQKAAIDAILASDIKQHAREIAESYQPGAARGKAFAEGGFARPDMLMQARRTYTSFMLDEASERYRSDRSSSYRGGQDELTHFRETTIKNGWASAGVFYLTLGRLQNAVYALAQDGSTFSQFNDIGGTFRSNDLQQALIGSAENPGVLIQFDQWWLSNITNIAPDISAESVATADASGSYGAVANAIFLPLITWWEPHCEVRDVNGDCISGSDAPHPLNPMQHVTDSGHNMMMGGTIAYIGLASAMGASSGAAESSLVEQATPFLNRAIAATGKAVAAGFSAGLGLFQMGALVVIAAGAVHAYVLPMIPYIMTVFFVGAMLLLVVEALIAAPLWAFFHIRMDGQDFVDNVQRPGYMIAFNLLLRPALMIFGLVLSFLVFGAMYWFVNQTFMPVARGLSASNGMGPIGVIIMIAILTYIHFQLAIRAFSMILSIPDRVTRWFGQGGENLGEDRDTDKAQGFIVANTSSRVEGMAKAGGMRSMVGGVAGGAAGAGAGKAIAKAVGGAQGAGGSGSTPKS